MLTRTQSRVSVFRWVSVAFAIAFTGCAGDRHSKLSPDVLHISVMIEQVAVDSELHPVATVSIVNRSKEPIAVSDTFGYGAYAWLGLRIQTMDGEDLWYPEGIPDLVIDLPQYTCLLPGEAMRRSVDLLSWQPTFGGQPLSETLSFPLQPGRLRLQALYTDALRHGRHRVQSRCAVIHGTVPSEWVEFEFHPPGSR